ncbi:MAG: hypothetical protein K1000chlam2_01465 [Chlamydiae bacterium]|nr:hypothetical protein [Chlamydiota bacterium]
MNEINFQADRLHSQNAADLKRLECTRHETNDGFNATALKVIAITAAIFLVIAAVSTMPPQFALLAVIVIILASGTVVVRSPRTAGYRAVPQKVWITPPAPLIIPQQNSKWTWRSLTSRNPVQVQPPRTSRAGGSQFVQSGPPPKQIPVGRGQPHASPPSYTAPGTSNVRVGVPQGPKSVTRSGNVIPGGPRENSTTTSGGNQIPGKR